MEQCSRQAILSRRKTWNFLYELGKERQDFLRDPSWSKGLIIHCTRLTFWWRRHQNSNYVYDFWQQLQYYDMTKRSWIRLLLRFDCHSKTSGAFCVYILTWHRFCFRPQFLFCPKKKNEFTRRFVAFCWAALETFVCFLEQSAFCLHSHTTHMNTQV